VVVDAFAEACFELVWGGLEFFFDWATGRGEESENHDIIAHYADTLTESRPPQDPNR
jgi:hypothetical protein